MKRLECTLSLNFISRKIANLNIEHVVSINDSPLISIRDVMNCNRAKLIILLYHEVVLSDFVQKLNADGISNGTWFVFLFGIIRLKRCALLYFAYEALL